MINQSDTKSIVFENVSFETFKAIATKIIDKYGDVFYNVPYYYKEIRESVFEVFTYNQLPEDVKEMSPQYECFKKAEKFLDECEQLVADGDVYCDSGFYYNDPYKAIKIAAGFNTD